MISTTGTIIGLNVLEIIMKVVSSLMSVIKSIHSSTSVNVLIVLTTCRNFVMELRQSSLLISSILPSSHTRWKFWTIRTFGGRRGLILEDSIDVAGIVGFLFVAIICVVS